MCSSDLNLCMLDLHLMFTTEVDRITKKMNCLSSVAGKSLDVVMKQLSLSLTPAQPPAAPERRTLSSRFKTASLRSMIGISSLSMSLEVPPSQMMLSPVALDQFFKRHHISSVLSDRDFYQALNRDMTDRKLYDFGWRQYLDYESMLKEALMVNHRASVASDPHTSSVSFKIGRASCRERV